MRVAELLRGKRASFNCASKRSSGAASRSRASALRRARRGAPAFAILARRVFFSIELFFAIGGSGLPGQSFNGRSVLERHVEALEQSLGFGVGLGGGDDDDVH